MSDVTATANAIRQFIFDNRETILLMVSAPPCQAAAGGGTMGDISIVGAFLCVFIIAMVMYFIDDTDTEFKRHVLQNLIGSDKNAFVDDVLPVPPVIQQFDPYISNPLNPLSPHDLLTNLQHNSTFNVLTGQGAKTFVNPLFNAPNVVTGASKFQTEKARAYLTKPTGSEQGGGLSKTSRDTYTDKILNPITGRLIDAHGKTAKMLLDESKSGRVKLPRQFISTIKRAIISHGV
jgi:hypothetical protein